MADNPLLKAKSIMEKFWTIEDATPNRQDRSVLIEAHEAARALQRLVDTWMPPITGPAKGKVLRFMGDALQAASGMDDNHILHSGHSAYLLAEQSYDVEHDPVEYSKLMFNHGNLVRLLDGGSNLEWLLEARRLYNFARVLSDEHLPDNLGAIHRSLETLESSIRLAEMTEQVDKGSIALGRMQEKLSIGGNDPVVCAEVQREFDEHLRTGSEAKVFSDFSEVLAQLGSVADNPAFNEALSEKQAQLKRLQEDNSDLFGVDATENEMLFTKVFGQIAQAKRNGEIDTYREQTLQGVLDEFRRVVNSPASSPNEMILKTQRMREIIKNLKPIVETSGSKNGS